MFELAVDLLELRLDRRPFAIATAVADKVDAFTRREDLTSCDRSV